MRIWGEKATAPRRIPFRSKWSCALIAQTSCSCCTGTTSAMRSTGGTRELEPSRCLGVGFTASRTRSPASWRAARRSLCGSAPTRIPPAPTPTATASRTGRKCQLERRHITSTPTETDCRTTGSILMVLIRVLLTVRTGLPATLTKTGFRTLANT